MRIQARWSMIMLFGLSVPSMFASALDGHGPDAWRVTGVAEGQSLQARMGPGDDYRSIGVFPHHARGLQQVTCVPFVFGVVNIGEAVLKAVELTPRWCLVHDAGGIRAGWVEARYLMPDYGENPVVERGYSQSAEAMIAEAEGLVRTLYDIHTLWLSGAHAGIYDAETASRFFTHDLVEQLLSGEMQEDPLFGGQDFNGSMQEPVRDAVQPVLRGMITVHVDFINFGVQQRATLRLRADTERDGAPVRIFNIEHGARDFSLDEQNR
ncbi:SH3 domain-containing protein [Marinobacterium marinum]|uniref:SH3 domain-containing protein n=1 Tax=Marinobacterium marinum TaxID=2756129 RepID=A0A7W1WX63_9GAMM|nr:hypothetical protein [Marinobacterium marinum]MBA4501826.1 hypothetical protein [Marinobacterium marinum]